jgi:hypothetical protein
MQTFLLIINLLIILIINLYYAIFWYDYYFCRNCSIMAWDTLFIIENPLIY